MFGVNVKNDKYVNAVFKIKDLWLLQLYKLNEMN